MKVFTIFGTRPEAIKMAPVIHELNSNAASIESVICITAQHREMLDQVLNVFGIVPDYDLKIMKKGQDLFDITRNILTEIKEILKKENPGIVLVQGDTTTAFAGSLAAYYLKIPIGHVEAGLRTYNKYSPFPEEKNRHLISVLADYNFAPTEWAKSNLIREGVAEEIIWVTGNTVVDALISVVDKQKPGEMNSSLEKYFKEKWDIDLSDSPGRSKLILVTGHRRESFGKGFENICQALKEIAQSRKDVIIVYPVHLNPNVQRPVKTILEGLSNIYLIEPLEYEKFVFLMKRSYIILSDSGGIQEEAPSLGIPVLVMRDTTERPEGVKTGVVRLVGTDKNKIIGETLRLLDNIDEYRSMSEPRSPYGDGHAAEKIVKILNELQ